jgi:CRISPR-associated exonuclease Cas4
MFPEEDLLPISALQHLLFCERQCALIHVERLWAENRLTVEGRHLHEKADSGKGEARGGVRIVRGLMLRSLVHGLYGKADVVEFRPGGGAEGTGGAAAIPFPVEYKRGKPKKDGSDIVQLCAQALCLEEMLATSVPAGAMFYGVTRRRVEVAFDDALRRLTLRTIERLHELIDSRRTPPAVKEKKCDRCSLLNLCLPGARPGTQSASRYVRRALAVALGVDGPESE